MGYHSFHWRKKFYHCFIKRTDRPFLLVSRNIPLNTALGNKIKFSQKIRTMLLGEDWELETVEACFILHVTPSGDFRILKVAANKHCSKEKTICRLKITVCVDESIKFCFLVNLFPFLNGLLTLNILVMIFENISLCFQVILGQFCLPVSFYSLFKGCIIFEQL